MNTWKTADPAVIVGDDGVLQQPKPVENDLFFPPIDQAVNNMSAHTKTLTHAMETIFASTESQEKYSIRLSPRIIDIINSLMQKHPHFFRTVENTFARIVKGNRIDSTDVPFVISLITQLYDILLTYDVRIFDYDSVPDMCSHILKFVFCVIVREGVVKLDSETNILLFLLCVDNLVDSCVKLLKVKKHVVLPPLAIAPVVPKDKGCC